MQLLLLPPEPLGVSSGIRNMYPLGLVSFSVECLWIWFVPVVVAGEFRSWFKPLGSLSFLSSFCSVAGCIVWQLWGLSCRIIAKTQGFPSVWYPFHLSVVLMVQLMWVEYDKYFVFFNNS